MAPTSDDNAIDKRMRDPPEPSIMIKMILTLYHDDEIRYYHDDDDLYHDPCLTVYCRTYPMMGTSDFS